MEPAERFDPEGRNSPGGEWRPGERRVEPVVEAETGSSVEAVDCGANRQSVVEQKAERAVETAGEEAKWQARNVDPGMEPVKAGAVAGE